MGKKEIALTAVLAVLVLGLVVGICELKLSGDELPAAEECGQLALSVRYGNDQEYIHIWQDENGDCYFFLPANVSLENAGIANLGRGASLWLDDVLYRKSAGLAGIECGRAYEARMQTADGRVSSKSLIFMQSENLSALFINTESGVLDNIHADKTVKEAADLYLYDEDGKKEYGKGISYIRCRGNTTFYEMEKKSYQIRFPREESLLGMEKAEKWVLLANSKDGSFLRNKIIYDFAGEYSDVEGMEGRYVDLYLNGQYEGNYYLCEKVEVGAGRVDIRDLEELNKTVNSEGTVKNAGTYLADDGSFKAVEGLTNPADITGGYLVVLSMGGYDDCRSGFTTSRGHSFKIVSPEAASVEQVAYIQNLFNEFE